MLTTRSYLSIHAASAAGFNLTHVQKLVRHHDRGDDSLYLRKPGLQRILHTNDGDFVRMVTAASGDGNCFVQ